MGYGVSELGGTDPDLFATLAEQRPDVVIVDSKDLGTPEALAQVSALQTRLRLPVVLAGAPSTLTKAEALLPFAFEVLHPPFGDAELRAAIEMVHCRHRAAEAMARLNQIIDALMQINYAALSARSRDELFASVTRVLVEVGGFDAAWVGWVAPGTTRIMPVAQSGRTEELLDKAAFDITDLPAGQGSPGFAMREGQSRVCNECPQEGCRYPLPQAPGRFGFRSCGSFPLRLQGQVRGVLSVCAGTPGFFLGRERDLLDEVAIILSSMLDAMEAAAQRRRSEAQRRMAARFREAAAESEARFRILFEQITDGLLVADASTWQILLTNGPMRRMLGRTEEEMERLSIRDIHPAGSLDRVRQEFDRVSEGRLEVAADIPVLRKDGTVFLADINSSLCQFEGRLCAVGLFRDTTERRDSKRQAEAQAAKLRLAHDAAGMVSWECDLATGAVHYSDNLATLLGPGDLTPYLSLNTLSPEIHPEDQPRLNEAIQGVIQHGGKFECDCRVRLPDGSWRWFLGKGDTVPAADGGTGRLVGVSLDITERKRIEAALRTREEIFYTIVAQAMASIVLVDATTGGFVEFNRAAHEGLGYTREAFASLRIQDIQAEHSSEAIQRNIETVRTCGGISFESKHRHRNGELRDVHVSIRALRLQERDYMATVWDDITERKRGEIALFESEERYRSLVETSSDWIWEVDAQARYTFASPRVKEHLGYLPQELIGKTPFDFMPEKVATRIRQAFNEIARKCEPFANLENVCRHRDGHDVVVETNGVPILGKNRELLGYRGTDRDISERKRLEAQFRQAQKLEAIGQLAGGVAHDFNNILAAILMQLGLLQMHPALDEDSRHALKELETGARSAANLTRQLLMFSRRSVLEVRPVNLNELIANLLKMLGRLIGEHITLRLEATAALDTVEADPGMIEQVLMNLVVNARDAMPKGGDILITTRRMRLDASEVAANPERRVGDFVCLSVADCGCGMDADTLKRVFEPFFTTKAPGQGTGLGLATVHGIVAQHKGWVEVSSELGRGTTFRVLLPAIPEPNLPARTPTASEPLRRGKETLLLVEDEHRVRQGIGRLLRILGYKVHEAEHGNQALELWPSISAEVDLVLTDMVMPEGVNGLELVAHLQALKPGLKAMICSGYSAEIVETDLRGRAGVTYLPKPFETQQLANAIRACLDTK
jgi:PAS domain S-box-containing protein